MAPRRTNACGSRSCKETGLRIVMACDWGTSKCVIGTDFLVYDDSIRGPAPLLMGDFAHETPMMATWTGPNEEDFIHGHRLREAAGEDKDLSDSIITFFKLGLYGEEGLAVTKRNESILAELPGNRTLDSLITAHLKAMINDCKSAILLSDDLIDFGRGDIEKALEKLELRITVPSIWTPDARRRMQSAARNAGLDNVVLASEPQCALAFLMHKFAHRNLTQRKLGKGDHILVADLGCGTGDFVMFKLEEKLAIKSKLKAVGHTTGTLVGSIRVDEYLFKLLVKREGEKWRERTQKRLGVTARDFYRRAMIAIDEAKRQYGQEARPHGEIVGIGEESEPIWFSKQEIEGAFDSVIAKIIAIIDVHIEQAKPDVLLITGGFAKSSYLMGRLRKHYEDILVVRPNETDTADCFPVPMGALLRHDNITVPQLPSKYGYAMLQDQDFRADLHLDSCTRYEDGKVTKKPWVKAQYQDESNDVVEDRLAIILEKGKLLKAGQISQKRLPMVLFVSQDVPVITQKFVYLSRTFQDCSMAMEWDEKSKDMVLRAGVHEWATLNVPLPKNTLEAGGFPTITIDGETVWHLQARVLVKNDGQDMRIGYQILRPPRKRAYEEEEEDEDGEKSDADESGEGQSGDNESEGHDSDDEGEGEDDDAEYEESEDDEHDYNRPFAFEVWDTVWESKHSEFI